jgi:hypothetical protein
VEISQNWFTTLFVDEAEAIYPSMMERVWFFMRADPETKGFICSDHPVGLIWTRDMPEYFGPGFAMPHTEITMPLTRN